MKLFMIFLLPITLVYVLTKNAYPAGRPDIRYSAAIVGFLTGVVYAFIECVFTSSYYLIPYAFFPNYFSHLAFEVLSRLFGVCKSKKRKLYCFIFCACRLLFGIYACKDYSPQYGF